MSSPAPVTAPPPKATTTDPPALDKYELVSRFAVGGMATIYRARRRSDGLACLVKIVHEHLRKDPTVSARFMREAQIAASLDHPNIARLLDARDERGTFYLAVEFVRGCDLSVPIAAFHSGGPALPLEVVVRIAVDVLAALAYAHGRRDGEGAPLDIVHRDVAPRNIVLGLDGAVKLIDFGLVRANVGSFRTSSRTILGTLGFMSPEAASGDPVDHRSDLYSMAVIAIELLSGRPLVEIIDRTPAAIFRQIHATTLPPLPGVPAALREVLGRGIEKRAADRFQSAASMAEAIVEASGVTPAPRTVLAEIVERFVRRDDREAWGDDEADGPTPVFTRAASPTDLRAAARDAASHRPTRPDRALSKRRSVSRMALPVVLAATVGAGIVLAPAVFDQTPAPAEKDAPPPPPRPTPTVVPRSAPPPASPEPTRAPEAADPPRRAAQVRRRNKQPPKSPPKSPSKSPLHAELEAFERDGGPMAELFRIATAIEASVAAHPDARFRERYRGRAKSSAMAGDVADLRRIVDALER